MAPAATWVWDEAEAAAGTEVKIDCLLPTGIIIQLNVRKDGLLADIKEVRWAQILIVIA